MQSAADQISRHEQAVASLRPLLSAIEASAQRIVGCLRAGGKLLLCGNGGSAADAQHIAAELVGRYVAARGGLPAVALTTDTSALTAIANDFGYAQVFARQVQALARAGDVLVAISTSGNSANVIEAVQMARSLGVHTIGLLGGSGGTLLACTDEALVVPTAETARVQECHILIGHIWCQAVDDAFAEPRA